MDFKKSAKIALWCCRVLDLLMIVLCVTLQSLLNWYHTYESPLSWTAGMAILVGFYLCVPAVLYALWRMDALLRTILRGEVFVTGNVRSIHAVCLCCAYVSAVCLAAGWFYPPLLFLFAIMAFLALTVSVVKSVMAAAVEIREENDLTV